MLPGGLKLKSAPCEAANGQGTCFVRPDLLAHQDDKRAAPEITRKSRYPNAEIDITVTIDKVGTRLLAMTARKGGKSCFIVEWGTAHRARSRV